VLVLLVLASSSIACRTGALVGWVVMLHKITLKMGVGVSVAKAQRPWTVVVEP
jgi:hypothetical protein